MIQTALFFILGFLSASFLAVLVAPAIWRRAVLLTRRRIEGAMPLKMDEIRAAKDMVRAQAAVEIRKLEMQIKALKEKSIEQILQAERRDEEVRELTREKEGRVGKFAELMERASALEETLSERVTEIAALGERVEQQERLLDERGAEIEKLGRLFDEASINASSRQIDLVAQETKLDQVTQELAALRGDRRDTEKEARDAAATAKSQQTALRAEQRKISTLEKQIERLTTSLSSAEEKLERRESELERLKEKTKIDNKPDRAVQIDLREEQARREAVEERLSTLTRENRQMRTELNKLRREGSDVEATLRDNQKLRDQLRDLAAEVVTMTERLEGPGSPITKILSEKASEGVAGQVSLAERIRTLQKELGPTS